MFDRIVHLIKSASMLVPAIGIAVGSHQAVAQDLVSRDGSVFIDSLYGNRQLRVGQEENFRLRLRYGVHWPVAYAWDFGDGTESFGNNVVHHYEEPGQYKIIARASNHRGSKSREVWITVVDPASPYLASDVEPGIPVLTNRDEQSSGEEVRTGKARLGPDEKPVEGIYFAWVMASYLDRMRAESELSILREAGLKHARIYVDESGAGAVAIRILTGKYDTRKKALNARRNLERSGFEPVGLISIL